MTIADITIEFICTSEDMVRDRIESLHFERYQIDHEILSVTPGRIPEGDDECDLPDYRRMHELQNPSTDSKWAWYVPEGCTSYIASVRLRSADDNPITRDRVLAVAFGDRDLGFSIGRIGETN